MTSSAASGAPAYGYQTPVAPDSPWPTFRRDERNTGRSPVAARYHGDRPWAFQTGKGIFSTPVIDGRGTVYAGSADHNFYAIAADGAEKWHCQTGEIVDSAGALLADGTVVFPSGDGYLRCLRAADGVPVWSLDARLSPRASYNNWFEGNVSVGHDGTLYAGNTNFNYYAVHPDGRLKWTYQTGANAWSAAAIGADGTVYWGSLDTRVRAVNPDGSEKWRRRTMGMVAASAALGPDGTLYVGSFDSTLYALDARTGRVRWKFRTGDHIYSSAALAADAAGHTTAIYLGSADGLIYALRPDGALLWTYDAGDPIRSSPALGRAPAGEPGEVLYFGCGDGRLYALDATDGRLRWWFDTTPDDPELRDRNDLNGSPALGSSGVYIGGEHGQLWYVPYDYPLHADDPRGRAGGHEHRAEGARLFYVTPGGSTHRPGKGDPPPVSPATAITLRLVVRRGGRTLPARLYSSPLRRSRRALSVRAEPPFAFHLETSADGRYLHILPEGFLEPGTAYRLHVEGDYYSGGMHLGNLTLGGRRRGRFSDSVAIKTAGPAAGRLPLSAGSERVSALEWSRLALPIPTMLPSLNQIGFDYIDWIVGTVAVTPPDAQGQGRLILWAIGGRHDEAGQLVADPASDFTLALSGTYRGDALIVASRRFDMAVTGIPIPFNRFELRGQLGPDLRVRPGAVAYADTRVLSIPTFGPYLVLAGLATNGWQKLVTMGTYLTRPYPQGGPANVRPPGVSVGALTYTPPGRRRAGRVAAEIRLEPGAAYPLAAHRPGILLLDAALAEAVALDYHAALAAEADPAGNVRAVTLTIPAGTRLPRPLEAVVLLDVFPIHRQALT